MGGLASMGGDDSKPLSSAKTAIPNADIKPHPAQRNRSGHNTNSKPWHELLLTPNGWCYTYLSATELLLWRENINRVKWHGRKCLQRRGATARTSGLIDLRFVNSEI